MARRDFVGSKGKSTRWDECSIWFPHFDPSAQRRETARNCDLLSDILTFPRWKIGNNINFEAGEARDRNGSVVKVMDLFYSDHICIDPTYVSIDGYDLRPFRRYRGVGMSSLK